MDIETAIIMLGFGVWTLLVLRIGINIGWRKSGGMNPQPLAKSAPPLAAAGSAEPMTTNTDARTDTYRAGHA